MDDNAQNVNANTRINKVLLSGLGVIVTAGILAFFSRTSSTLDRLVTDVAVIKALGESNASENLPARVTALEGLAGRTAAQVTAMETNRWTRKDHQAYERLIEIRFTRNEKNIDGMLEALKDAPLSAVLGELRDLKKRLSKDE